MIKIKLNELIIDDVSTLDLSFEVFVEETDGFNFSKKKNQLIETEYMTGAIKHEIKAWSTIEKNYTLYCPFTLLKDMRKLKAWAKDNGKLRTPDEPDVYYQILDVIMEPTKVDPISGYRIKITFITEPFGYETSETEKTYRNGQQLVNETNAPMYPKIIVNGQSNSEVSLSIGEQTLYLKRLHNKVTIECKPLQQNVFNESGAITNGILRGDFFEIMPGEHTIALSGIDSINILERWAWL